MVSVQQLYELWADDADLREELALSVEPRGLDSLFEAFAALGPKPGDLVLDAGSRDARHAIRLAREHRVRVVALDALSIHSERARAAVAEAGLAGAVEVVEARIESMPLGDASVDWIWCRDVLVHVDVRRGMSELARVLKPGGALLAYVTLATKKLEPLEAARLGHGMSLSEDGFDAKRLEAAAAEAGFALRGVDRLGSEWRERMIEDGTWDPRDDLLALARLERRRARIAEEHGRPAVAAVEAGLLWGIYQLLGKLCPTVYVWERRA